MAVQGNNQDNQNLHLAIDSQGLLHLLSTCFFKLLLIDACSSNYSEKTVFPHRIPGSRFYPFLSPDNLANCSDFLQEQTPQSYAGNGFTNVNVFSNVQSAALKHRLGHIVIVYDEEGLEDCHAASVARLFAAEGLCAGSYYLAGGITSFYDEYPEFFPHPKGPLNACIVHPELLGSLAGLPGEFPIHQLRSLQNHLIQSVWFGKVEPSGDLPLLIVPDFLYLSSCLAADMGSLKSCGINHVLRLGWGFVNHATADDNITYHDFPIEDSPFEQIHHLFDETTNLIDSVRRSNGKILVHCHAGVSRSSTIILAYMIKFLNMSLYNAWNETYKIRPIIRPNVGFASALQAYEAEHFKKKNEDPSLEVFWMSESYLYYIDYVDTMYRVASVHHLPWFVFQDCDSDDDGFISSVVDNCTLNRVASVSSISSYTTTESIVKYSPEDSKPCSKAKEE